MSQKKHNKALHSDNLPKHQYYGIYFELCRLLNSVQILMEKISCH